MSTKSYRAPWGGRVWLVTGLIILIGIATAVALPLTLPAKNSEERLVRWLIPLLTVTAIGVTAFWTVRGYELTGDTLVVRRSFWVNRISLADIQSAEADPLACKGAWKTCGNDGLFAMHGRFRSKRLGKFQAYVTDPGKSIILKVPGDTIVVSPENPRSFLHELNRRLDRLKESR